jgi:hypothetical protein
MPSSPLRAAPFAALAALAASLCLAPACTSSPSSSPGPADAGDASLPPLQLVGEPCDPTLSNPCDPGPPCFQVTCDPELLRCTEVGIPGCIPGTGGFDAAGLHGSDASSFDDAAPVQVGGGACFTDAQCSGGLRCGYPFTAGCMAMGTCLIPDVPFNDAGQPYEGCGCNGQPVLYVTHSATAAPVASPTPCMPDAGRPDAGADAALDADTDAGD